MAASSSGYSAISRSECSSPQTVSGASATAFAGTAGICSSFVTKQLAKTCQASLKAINLDIEKIEKQSQRRPA
jgi:hypothetical protein